MSPTGGDWNPATVEVSPPLPRLSADLADRCRMVPVSLTLGQQD